MNLGGLVILLMGGLVLCQVIGGDALRRLRVLG